MSSIPAKDWKSVWELLTSGIRDYVRKNGFTDVVLGLSGGMDSALVAALAVDALGKDHVHGVMMPLKKRLPPPLPEGNGMSLKRTSSPASAA